MANVHYEKYLQKALNPIPCLFVTGATNATPIEVTTSLDHQLATNDVVAIVGVLGNTATNGVWTITKTASNKFTLNTSVGNGAYTSGGNVLLTDALLKKISYIIRFGVGSSGSTYGDDIKAVWVNVSGAGTLYAVDAAQHEFLSDIAAGARIAMSPVLANKTDHTGSGASFVGGVADADDIVFTAVGPSGTTVEALVLYKDTGTASTSPLMIYVDTATTNLPFTTNDGDVTYQISAGANRIFRV